MPKFDSFEPKKSHRLGQRFLSRKLALYPPGATDQRPLLHNLLDVWGTSKVSANHVTLFFIARYRVLCQLPNTRGGAPRPADCPAIFGPRRFRAVRPNGAAPGVRAPETLYN